MFKMNIKRKLLFQGTGTALVTPFLSDKKIDLQSIKKLVEFQIESGVEALVPTATTGESVTLTEDEQILVIETVIEQAQNRVKIIAGAGSNSTMKAIKLAKRAKAIGVDAILSVAPYYNKPTQEGFFQHYAAIAESVDIPIVVYNVPGRTSSNIEPETIIRMIDEIPMVVGIKEASGNFSQIMEILRYRPKGFGVWSGDDAITLPLMALGANGVISVVSNQVPQYFSKMVRYCLEGEFNKALKIHYKLLPLMHFNFKESNPIPVKAALAMMKKIKEQYRLPLVPLSKKYRPTLRKLLSELELLK